VKRDKVPLAGTYGQSDRDDWRRPREAELVWAGARSGQGGGAFAAVIDRLIRVCGQQGMSYRAGWTTTHSGWTSCAARPDRRRSGFRPTARKTFQRRSPRGRMPIFWRTPHAQFYEVTTVDRRVLHFRLTMDGWERYQSLKKTEIESPTAFMAMKFGQMISIVLVDECFRPAVIRTGFKLQLLTEGQPAGLIDDQLRAAILRSRFVISDLTHGSPGAYWEAGFGEGLGRDVIYTCEKSAWEKQGTHFDTHHLNTIIWDFADLKKAEDRLTATIRATFRADAKQTDD
jgi:hypothetical protein